MRSRRVNRFRLFFAIAAVFCGLAVQAAARLRLPLAGDWLTEPPKGGSVTCVRDLAVPVAATNKRALLVFRMLNARAEIAVDGRTVAHGGFPGGAIDLGDALVAGRTHRLGVTLTDGSSDSKYGIRGVSGETELQFVPRDGFLRDVFVEAVSEEEVTLVAVLSESLRARPIRLEAVVTGCGETRDFASSPTVSADGRLTCRVRWPGAARWDVDTPGNLYEAQVSLTEADGREVDAFTPITFGFRMFKINGRGLVLNGVPIRLRGFYTRLLNGSSAQASSDSIAAALAHMKRLGGNFLITGNFGFACGDQRAPDGLLEACDAAGILVGYSLPHCRTLTGDGAAFRELTERAIRLACNHPCVVLYTTSHNWCDYHGDLNPLKIDGRFDPTADPKPSPTWRRHRQQAERAEAIVRAIDPTRPVHHHAGGNIGDFHSVNAYFNWMPAQERSDWPEQWATNGIKPLAVIEWGLPYEPSWSSYRGPAFIWKTKALQSCWAAEYAAAIFGDAAYLDTPQAHAALRTETMLRHEGPFAWTRLAPSLKRLEPNYNGVQAAYAADNWRSLRAWGVPVMIPQNQSEFVRRGTDGELTASGEAIRRWNAPVIGFIGGADAFTDKRRAYRPGETLRKTLVLVNDLRHPVEVIWTAKLSCGGDAVSGQTRVPAGNAVFVPVMFSLPVESGPVRLDAHFACGEVEVESDSFEVTVVPETRVFADRRLVVFDPDGRTCANLRRLGFEPKCVASVDEAGVGDLLAIGRDALASNALERLEEKMARGLRVIVFEQSASVLQRAGFRVTEYGLRRAFSRDDALLDGLPLCDWSGESTLVSPYLDGLPRFEQARPADPFAPMGATRVWRCRMRGAVASVLPEKPERGGWRALLDGGFDLRYAALLERRTGRGGVVLCQLDVTARTMADPAADELVRRLVARPQRAEPSGPAVVRGAVARALCDLQGVRTGEVSDGASLFVCSADGEIPWEPSVFRARVEVGMKALLLDMKADELSSLLPEVSCAHQAKISMPVRFPDEPLPSCLAGCSNADWMWHGAVSFRALSGAGVGTPSLRVIRLGKGTVVVWQVPPNRIDARTEPQLRLSWRHAHYLLSCLLANLGAEMSGTVPPTLGDRILDDEPYRYYRW